MTDTEPEWDDQTEESYNSDPDEVYSSPDVYATSTFYRLRWQIRDGPIWENIHVVDDGCKVGSPQRPFQDEAGRLHEIAALPFSCEPVQAVTVRIHRLDGMEAWKERDGTWSPRRQDRELIPRIRVFAGEGRDFVSIGDYVLPVHEFLLSQRSRILKELGLLEDGREWPSDTQLWVDPGCAGLMHFFNSEKHDLAREWEEMAVFTLVQQTSEEMDKRRDEREEYIPVYPAKLASDEEFAAFTNIWPSLAFLRLRWRIREGPISENISVLEDVFDPTSPERPFQDASSGEYHEIAGLPFSRPPHSQLEIAVEHLDGLEAWKCDGVDDRFSPERPDSSSAPRLQITAGEGRDFISIGDYVSQVYDWLAALRPQILKEVGLNIDEEEWEEDTKLWFDPLFPNNIQFVHDREGTEWKQWQHIASIASKG